MGGAALARLFGPPALDSRSLVVIQMSGGNDGLNTVVPYEDDRYHRARPRLRVAKANVVKLDGCLGLHPEMEPMRALLDRGELAVVTDVGMPTPDRSHFHALEIWHSCCDGADPGRTGWIGCAADALGGRDGAAPALHIGSTDQPFSLVSERAMVPSLVSLERATIRGDDRRELLDALAAVPRAQSVPARVALGAREAYAFSSRLAASARSYKPASPYPDSPLGRKLRTIAQILDAGFATRVFEVEIDGFD